MTELQKNAILVDDDIQHGELIQYWQRDGEFFEIIGGWTVTLLLKFIL